jgi:hypothetical protein
VQGSVITVTPLDSFRSRVYVAPLGLWLTLDAGTFKNVEVNSRTGVVRVGLTEASEVTPAAHLRIEQPAKINGVGTYQPVSSLESERNAYIVPLQKETTWVELSTSH